MADGVGAPELPILTLEGWGEEWLVNPAYLPCVIVQATGLAGTLSVTPLGVPLPLFTLDAYGGISQPLLPMPTLSAQGFSSPRYSSSVVLPAPTLSATGWSGSTGAAAFRLPMLTVIGGEPNDSDILLPMLTLAAVLQGSSAITSGVLELPAVTLDAQGTGFSARADDLVLPAVTLDATLIAQGRGTGAFDLPLLTVDGVMVAGTVSTGTFELPIVTLDASGFSIAQIGTGTLTMPMVTLSGGMYGPAADTTPIAIDDAPDSTLVMNLRTGAMTTYRNFPFTSYATTATGRVLATSPDGLYALEGTDDDGNAIEALVTMPISDLGAPALKRITAAYVNYSSNGPIELRFKLDDRDWYSYQLAETRPAGMYRNRVKMGKGAMATNMQAQIRTSSQFDLQSLELDVTSYPARRV